MKQFIRIGVGLAKNYFQIHALEIEGGPAVTRKLTRIKMREFFARIAPAASEWKHAVPRTTGRANSGQWDTKRF